MVVSETGAACRTDVRWLRHRTVCRTPVRGGTRDGPPGTRLAGDRDHAHPSTPGAGFAERLVVIDLVHLTRGSLRTVASRVCLGTVRATSIQEVHHMPRNLRKIGTNSGNDGCPTLYEIPGTDRYVVQGDRVTDPGELSQLDNLSSDEGAVTVPRELLANFGPKEAVRASQCVSFEDFSSMFNKMRHSAWRLETRRRYASDEGAETYAQFAAGEPVTWDLGDPWCVNRREQSALGKRFERVRILDDPPTPGQMYLLDNARRNTAVGEDIRTLPRFVAEELRLPAEDFWIFDIRVVALLLHDDEDRMTGVELITNPVDVLRYAQVREAAWHHAVPYDSQGR